MSKETRNFNKKDCEIKNDSIKYENKINLTESPCEGYKFAVDTTITKQLNDTKRENNDTNIDDLIKGIPKVEENKVIVNENENKEPQIAPFDEWTKEKLKMNVESNNNKNSNKVPTENISIVSSAKNGNTNKQHPQVTTKRNYASKECGAKVILSNDEAEFKSAILNDKERDVYMRNPCEKAKEKFAVIELCETIVPTGIELANFELFSSGPKKFKVFVSERFPTSEWHEIGEFEMDNNRDIQKFDLIKTGLYVKYAKIELTSHWGKEHYCTLSMVRIFGISMVEEYEAEASALNIPVTQTQVVTPTINYATETSSPQPKELIVTEINKSPEEERSVKTLVGKVVNAVGSQIEGIINTVIMKNTDNVPKGKDIFNSLTLEEQCTKCPLNHESSYSYELCHFYNYVIRIISRRNIVTNVMKNKQLSTVKPPSVSVINNNNKLYRKYDRYMKKKKIQRRKLISKKYLEAKLKKEEVSTIEQKIINQNGGDHSLPAANMNYKESVFMKLNKRLSNLELNISLTSEYLGELSKRYLSQTNDNMKMHEGTIKKSEDLIKRLMTDFRNEINDKVNNLKDDILSFKKNLKNNGHRMGFYDNSLSVTKPPVILNNECTSGRHMLDNGNDKIWTTEQVLFLVIGAQIFTIICIFLLQWLFSWLYSKKNYSKNKNIIEEMRSELEIIKNIVMKDNIESSNNSNINTINEIEPLILKKRRKRKKKTIAIDNGWDSALDNPSMPSETPTPSELSIDVEATPLVNENLPLQQRHNLLLTANGFQIHSNRKNSKLKRLNASLIINA
uniref:SUN domain-containing protein n=1 Tax=Parastrongyloides trichosuri TaxID=131310 RepID=A0A0N4ZIM1_PARTI